MSLSHTNRKRGCVAQAFLFSLEVIAQGWGRAAYPELGIGGTVGIDYRDKRWRHMRERILGRDGHQCRECRRYGLAVQATTVHHGWPAEDFPALAWESWNLISLCSKCHNAMHDRDTGELTALGLTWRRRVSPPP